ncbi:MAG: hypothetical protein PVJ53_13150 [Desulfobacterales bacterium]|jgi:hypothetical protein
MQSIHPIQRLIRGLIVTTMLTILLAACQSSGQPPEVPPVPAEKRIALQTGGPHQGQYDTGDLTVGYTYQLKTDLTGDIDLKGGISSVRYGGRKMNIYANFLDDTGKVLQRKIVLASGKSSSNIRNPSSFETTLPLPPGTTGMMFSSYVQASRGHR